MKAKHDEAFANYLARNPDRVLKSQVQLEIANRAALPQLDQSEAEAQRRRIMATYTASSDEDDELDVLTAFAPGADLASMEPDEIEAISQPQFDATQSSNDVHEQWRRQEAHKKLQKARLRAQQINLIAPSRRSEAQHRHLMQFNAFEQQQLNRQAAKASNVQTNKPQDNASQSSATNAATVSSTITNSSRGGRIASSAANFSASGSIRMITSSSRGRGGSQASRGRGQRRSNTPPDLSHQKQSSNSNQQQHQQQQIRPQSAAIDRSCAPKADKQHMHNQKQRQQQQQQQQQQQHQQRPESAHSSNSSRDTTSSTTTTSSRGGISMRGRHAQALAQSRSQGLNANAKSFEVDNSNNLSASRPRSQLTDSKFNANQLLTGMGLESTLTKDEQRELQESIPVGRRQQRNKALQEIIQRDQMFGESQEGHYVDDPIQYQNNNRQSIASSSDDSDEFHGHKNNHQKHSTAPSDALSRRRKEQSKARIANHNRKSAAARKQQGLTH
jgi:hypothetical protein